MIDFYLTQFYQDVKDPAWPDISIYNDILKLSPEIKTELESIHHLDSRLSEIESIDYWRENSRGVRFGIRKNDVVFVPVLKCASTYFRYNFLERFTGWEIVDLHKQDWTKIKAFGCMMHPLVRRIKGITEVLFNAYSEDRFDHLLDLLKNDSGFRGVIATISVSDLHSMPYDVMFGPYLNKIHWIPMEIGNNAMIHEVNQFLLNNNIADQIPFNESKHQSTDKKLEIYKQVIEVCFQYPPKESHAIFLFANDLKFYHNLIKNFKLSLTK